MKTAAEREAAFRKEFDELCKKHNAEVVITDDGKPWGMHSPLVEITMEGQWNSDNETIAEFTLFHL